MALYFAERSMNFAELYENVEIETDTVEVNDQLDDDVAEIGPRQKTGEFERHILLEEIKRHGMIHVISHSPKTLDNFLNSVECLQAQIEYIHSKRR
jgi:hypothetical protein